MIIINNIECTIDNVYDVLYNIVTSAKTIDELYSINVEIIADNNLEIMCIYEQIVTEHAFALFANEYNSDVDEIEQIYDDIKKANKIKTIDNILKNLKHTEKMLINSQFEQHNDCCNKIEICNDE